MTEPKKDSGKILDALKGLLTVSKTGKKETAAKPTEIKATGTAKPTLKSTTKPPVKPAAKPVIKPAAGVSKPPAQNLRVIEAKQALEKQAEVLHSKTHQDLINAAYKAAEKLGIAPWVLLRAAGWGHFTENRGKKYDGPAIDEIKTLDDAQKKALKDVLGL
jgi:hypothetical protein